MQHFSNYFVRILVIKSKCWGGGGGQNGPGEGAKKFHGAASPSGPLLSAPMIVLHLPVHHMFETSCVFKVA